jgi:hypothetical protein
VALKQIKQFRFRSTFLKFNIDCKAMIGRHILVLIAIGMLVFGCSGLPGGGPTGGETGGVTGGNPLGGGTGAAGGTSGTGATGGETGGTDGQQDGGQTGGAGDDFAGKTYAELMGLGIPMQCDITITGEESTMKYTMYTNGAGDVRSETHNTDSGSTCTTIVTIMKGDKAYVGCDGGSMFPDTGEDNPFAGCEWMELDLNESTTSVTASIDDNAPDYTSAPPEQINCVPWVPDSSKFATPSNACNVEEITNDMMNQYSD